MGQGKKNKHWEVVVMIKGLGLALVLAPFLGMGLVAIGVRSFWTAFMMTVPMTIGSILLFGAWF